jgi:hypothetical protein
MMVHQAARGNGYAHHLIQVSRHHGEQGRGNVRQAFPLAERETHQSPGDVIVLSIALPDGVVQGDSQNGGLRFDLPRDRLVDSFPLGAEWHESLSRRNLGVTEVEQTTKQQAHENENTGAHYPLHIRNLNKFLADVQGKNDPSSLHHDEVAFSAWLNPLGIAYGHINLVSPPGFPPFRPMGPPGTPSLPQPAQDARRHPRLSPACLSGGFVVDFKSRRYGREHI